MPITRCPGCQESLEVPDVVPGGLVACPYCGKEFPAGGGGAAPRRGPVRAPARGGGRPPRRRDDRDGYYDDRPARGYRRKKDPLPIVFGIAAVVVMAVIAIVVLINSKKKEEARDDAFLAKVAATPAVSYSWPQPRPAPEREPLTFKNRYKPGDMITIMDASFSSSLSFPKGMENTSWSPLNFTFKSAEHGENVTGMEGDWAVHEGTYELLSFISPGTGVSLHNTGISARFLTDDMGRLQHGSFQVTAGPSLNPLPTMLGDRNLGALPNRPVRLYEEWGRETLTNPLASYVRIGGRNLDSMGISGRREGGWAWEGGNLESTSDGAWTHKAIIDFRLHAVENGQSRITFQGEPCELSYAVAWTGKAQFNLKQQLLVRVERLRMQMKVRLKTPTEVHDWTGSTELNFGMYKDP